MSKIGLIAAALIAALLAGGLVIYLQRVAAGSAAPATRVVLNVRDYGAKGDGVSNDYAALTKACAAAAAAGEALYLPAGTYLVNARLTVPAKVSITGDGSSSWLEGPLVVGSSDTFTDLRIGRVGYACYLGGISGVTFRRVRFSGGGGSYSGTSPYLDSHVITIGGGNVSNVLFDTCEIERNAGTEDSGHGRHFDNVFVSDGVSPGQPLVHDVLFKDTHFGVSNGTATGCPRFNVEIWEDHSARSRVQGFHNINFEGCVFETADDENLDYSGASLSSDGVTPASGYSHVTGCTFRGNGASWVWYNDITVEGGAGDITASGNTFYRGAGFAMAMEGTGGHNAFTNNVVDTTNNVLNTGITHDYIAFVDIASSDNTVTGNTITSTGPSPWCIDLEETSSYNTVTGNTLTGGDVYDRTDGSGHNVTIPNTLD